MRGSVWIERGKISDRYDRTAAGRPIIGLKNTADSELFRELLYFPPISESGVSALHEKCGVVGSVALDDGHVKREVTLAIRLEGGQRPSIARLKIINAI